MSLRNLHQEAIELLRQLVAIPSFSKEEAETADTINTFLHWHGIATSRKGNNIWAVSEHYDPQKPTLLLNSHHDTVRPAASYTRNPFEATVVGDKLYGLGSNDAGGALVSLLATFLNFHAKQLPFNLLFLASAEEEISGRNGVEGVLPELPPIWAGIVGEPTLLQMAIAEKGLLVLDGTARGVAGHAARAEGENAIYRALEAIQTLQAYSFRQVSPLLGPVKISVTQVEAGTQHNVVPDCCTFVVDVRTNEYYTNEQVLESLQSVLSCELKPRSLRLQSSRIGTKHPLIQAGTYLGLPTFGSPTLSDQALMPFPTVKLGPGDSARSHMADEFIFLTEIEAGIHTYIEIIHQLAQQVQFLKHETLAKSTFAGSTN